MKTKILIILLCTFASTLLAQNPSYQEKLYYTCKVWGFVKYFHSQVSICEVNWDSVLVSNLPRIKNAVTNNDFNDALDTLLQDAGPMAIAAYPYPNTVPPELRRNLDFGWFNDTVLRPDIKAKLDTIKDNFWPHPICWVTNNNNTTSYTGWLVFPYDNPMIDNNTSTNYPDEYTRLLLIFKYWNIIRYFNPYNYVLDVPWDSTLYNILPSIVADTNYVDFFKSFRKITSKLDDAHVEGYTSSTALPLSFLIYYSPRLVLEYAENDYVVCKSDISDISRGDIIISVDGRTIAQCEDSLRPYISAGNPSVFRRFMSSYLLRGESNSAIQIIYQDSLGINNTINTFRDYFMYQDTWMTSYYPNDTLGQVKWRKWNCDVGYVNMGKLVGSDVDAMYSDLQNTTALIFDLRNYPNTTGWAICNRIYADYTCYAKLPLPELYYPGTFYWQESYLGSYNNSSWYQGKVIVLCNEKTQSQAEYTCMMLQAMPDAVVVGSQTAGTDGNITYFNVSQDIQTGFTSLGVYYPNGDSTQRIGIVPDSVVYRTQAGIRQGRDEVLEKALQIAGCTSSIENQNPIAEQTFTIYPNPTDGLITLESNLSNKDGMVSIYSILGKMIYEAPICKQKTNIDLTSFGEGIYLIKMNNSRKNGAKKIVLE